MLNDYLRNLSNSTYVQALIDEAIDVASVGNSSLEERLRERQRGDSPEELYREYLITALASGYLGGMDETELRNYILAEAVGRLPLMENFLEEKPKLSEKQYANRLGNYLVTPFYFYVGYAEAYKKTRSGRYSQYRRVCVNDDKTCVDCQRYAESGWVNLSSALPVPGSGEDRCGVNCRCQMEYR